MEQVSNPIWLFDGVCVLCSRSVQILLQHERDHTLHFIAIQSEQGRALATQHGIDPDNPASFIYLKNGAAYEASDAVIHMLDHARWTLRWLKLARILPRSLRDKAYYALAQNRYKLFGKHDICMLPTPGQGHRFTLPKTT